MAELMHSALGKILGTTKFYDSALFRVGWTLIPGMSAMSLVLCYVKLSNIEEPDIWRRRFAEAFLEGVVAEVQERDWRSAELHYLDCWKMLLDVEPAKRTSNRKWCAEGVYDWVCMCVGTRLICMYQQYARDFPKCLAVLAWVQRRQLYPDPDGALPLNNWWPELQRHKALLLFHWSWAEELAGNLRDAHYLQELALRRMQEGAQEPVPARVILSASLARIAGNSGRDGEARLWMRTMSHYWERDHVRFSHDWEKAVDRSSACINKRWASIISDFHGSRRWLLVTPTGILPRSPLRFDNDINQFYTQLGLFPRVMNGQGVFALGYWPGADLANWDEQLMVHFEKARTADREEQWEGAVSSYLTCKNMILEQADRHPAILSYYRSTAILIGTQLAHLYQWRLRDYQKSAAILEWLLSMVEPQEVSPQLLLHHSQVAYQYQRAKGEDGHEAVEQIQQVMALAPNTSPLPDLSAILCLGLAESCAEIDPLEAHKWLAEAFRQSHRWHFEWQVCLGMRRIYICTTINDFTEVREHALKLITKLDGIGSGQLEANIRWSILSKCYCVALDSCFLMDGHGGSTDVGLQWDVEAKNLEKELRDKVMDLMEELEEHPLTQLDDTDESKHLFGLELTPAGARMAGYALCRTLAEAVSRASLSEGRMMMNLQDYNTVLSCVKREIFFAEDMLSDTEQGPRQGSRPGWHWLLGLSYTRLGELLEMQPGPPAGDHQQSDEAKFDYLKRTYEAARDHLLQVKPDYSFNAQLAELLGFSYMARSWSGNLEDDKFRALSGVAIALGLTLWLQPRSAGVSELDAFLDAVAQAEVYSRLPRQTISEQFAAHRDQEFSRLPASGDTQTLTTFYDYLLVKIIEKREQRANTQSTWSKVLDVRRLAMLRFYQTVDDPASLLQDKYRPLNTLFIDSLVWLEQGLSTLYSFQWLRFYSKDRPPYYWQVLKCWQNPDLLWRIICECRHFCDSQTPPIIQVYYQFSKGIITIFLIDHEDSVEIIEPPSSLENVEEILRNFYGKKPKDRNKTEKPKDPHESLKLLYKILIEPISKSLINTSRKVIFIAEQILASVPFAILMDPATGKYLFQQCTVSVAPSALALWHCIKRYTSTSSRIREEPKLPLKPALVVADPAYADHPDFPRLAQSAEEIGAVQRIFEESKTSCTLQVVEKVGMEANVKAALEAAESPGRSRPFIHFAVHAGAEQKMIPRTDPGKLQYGSIKQGTIYLADPIVKEWPPAAAQYYEQPGRGQEGRPSEPQELVEVVDGPAYELADDQETRGVAATKKKTKGKSTKKKEVMSHPSEWQLRADDDILGREKSWNVDMVVLSACESSKGQMLQSGTYLNLPRALTLAGVPCILAAQWPIEDACSTPRLIQYFYQGMKDGLDASTALQIAMQNMLQAEGGKYNVFQWGAFMVWGLPTVRLPIAQV